MSVSEAVRPPIADVVSRYVELKRAGRELMGLCPFHTEKTPSFSVSGEKGLYHCFGCGASGDVISFIQRIEGLDFKEALEFLGVSTERKQTWAQLERCTRRRVAAKQILAWGRCASQRIGERIREIGHRQHTAEQILRELPDANDRLLIEEIEHCEREWELLCEFQDSLWDPDALLEMWDSRGSIEAIVGEPIEYTGPSPEVAAWAADTRPLKDRIPQWLHQAIQEDARKLVKGEHTDGA